MGQSHTPGKKCKINVVKLLTPYVESVECKVWGGGGPNRNGENRMTIKPSKVFEREDGSQPSYEVKVAGKYDSIERWQGMSSVGEWLRRP